MTIYTNLSIHSNHGKPWTDDEVTALATFILQLRRNNPGLVVDKGLLTPMAAALSRNPYACYYRYVVMVSANKWRTTPSVKQDGTKGIKAQMRYPILAANAGLITHEDLAELAHAMGNGTIYVADGHAY